MERQLSVVGYWLGVICTILALIGRGLAALKVYPLNISAPSGASVSYLSFLHGAVLFFLLAIASWCRTAKS